jgi:hypothetical protein
MSASTRTAQRPLSIQLGVIFAIVAVAMVAALAFAVSSSGMLKPAVAPAAPAALGPVNHDLPDAKSGAGAAIQPDGVWMPNGRGSVEFVPFQASKPYSPPAGYWKYDGRGGVEYVETPTYTADPGLAPRSDDTQVIHGPRIAPE